MSSLYVIEQVRSPDMSHKINPVLYGLTREKSLAKEFMKTRKSGLFELTKLDLKKNEAYNMLDDNPGRVLFKDTLRTSVEYGEQRNISIVMTQDETVNIMTKVESFWGQLGIFTNPNVFILDDKYLRTLNDLGYFVAMTNLSSEVSYDIVNDINYEMNKYGNFFKNHEGYHIMKSIVFDEFQIFMHFYGWTMIDKNKGGKQIAYDYIIS